MATLLSFMNFQDVKISDDNILSDIMSDLDGSASSTMIKPTAAPSKNIIESSKKDAQNYFKSLTASVKKLSAVALNRETLQEEKVVSITSSALSVYL